MSQVRVPFNNLLALLQQLVAEKITWASVMQRYVVVSSADSAEGETDGAATAAAAQTAAASSAPTVVQYSTRGSFSRPNFENAKK
jgi:hypothetical protein